MLTRKQNTVVETPKLEREGERESEGVSGFDRGSKRERMHVGMEGEKERVGWNLTCKYNTTDS